MQETIGSRLRALRDSATQEEFSNTIGVVKNTIARYERDERTPDAAFLQKLFELGYNPTWVLTGQGSMRGGIIEVDENDQYVPPKQTQALNEPWSDIVFVKRYHVRLSAGSGALDAENVTVDFLAFRRQFLEFIGVSPDKAAIVRVRGDSMEPALIDGDTVMIDTADTVLRPRARENSRRRAYAILQTMREGEALRCKFVECVHTNGVEAIQISSLNSDYPDETPGPEDVKILGRIRWNAHTWL